LPAPIFTEPRIFGCGEQPVVQPDVDAATGGVATDGTSPTPAARVALVVSASPRKGSVSAATAIAAGQLLKDKGYLVHHAEQRLLPMVPAGLDGASYPTEITELMEVARRADPIVVAGPVQRSAVSGATRNLVELLCLGMEDKHVLLIVSAGSPRAHMAATAFRADLLVNFGASAHAPVVLTPELDPNELRVRLRDAVEALVAAVEVRS
jgi:NAD(P)H-dependent FMN reductase